MQVIFDHSEEEASDIKTFYFKPEGPFNYTAGQYVELTLDHKDPDNRGIKRWFTLSSSPNIELISITTKFAAEKRSSFKQALALIQPGHRLTISEPMGEFVLPQFIQTPMIFVAGGIGITPFHSILSWLADKNEERPVKLFYAVANEDEIIFQNTFDKAKVKASIVVDQPSAAWGGEQGKLNGELILSLAQPTKDTLFYISGPEPMVENLRKELLELKVQDDQLVLDFFPNYKTI